MLYSKILALSILALASSSAHAKTVLQCNDKVKQTKQAVVVDRNDIVIVQGKQMGSSPYQWFSEQNLPSQIQNPTGPNTIGAPSIRSFKITVIDQINQIATYRFAYKRGFDPVSVAPLATCEIKIKRK